MRIKNFDDRRQLLMRNRVLLLLNRLTSTTAIDLRDATRAICLDLVDVAAYRTNAPESAVRSILT